MECDDDVEVVGPVGGHEPLAGPDTEGVQRSGGPVHELVELTVGELLPAGSLRRWRRGPSAGLTPSVEHPARTPCPRIGSCSDISRLAPRWTASFRRSTSATSRLVTSSGDPMPVDVGRAARESANHSISGAVSILVELETPPDRPLGVVVALYHLAAADVTYPWNPGGLSGTLKFAAAVRAHAAAGEANEDLRCIHFQVEDHVEGVGHEHVHQRQGLAHGAGKAVEHEAAVVRVGTGQALSHHPDHDLVGHELSRLEVCSRLLAEFRT